jgi:dUTP pyrophosphatase
MDKEIRQLEDDLKDLLHQLESAMDKEFQTARIEEMTGVDIEQLEKEFKVSIKETLGYEKVHPDAKDPQYVYESDSGFDLCSTEDTIIEGFGRALVPTGLKFDIPKGFEIQVRPKSGLALKEGLTVLNTPGTVDAGYNGEVKVILYNTSVKSYEVKKGQKIAQAVLCPVHAGFKVNLVNKEVEEKDRGSNGFGSTGI